MSAKNAILYRKMLTNIAIVLLIIMLLNVLLPGINIISYGSQYREQTNIEEIDEIKYPGYKELLQKLKEEHPNWTFTLLYTGLDWNTVLYNEQEVIGHDANLVQNKTGEWVCQASTCMNEDGTSKAWEGTNWYCASYKAVSYYMDPRNFLTAEELFQFERLSYTDGIYTVEGIEKIIANTFMSNTSPRAYYKNETYSEKTFAQIMLEAGQNQNISPYHIASRIRQEVVKSGGVPSDSVTGTVKGFESVFNFFNIGASTGAGAIQRGLEYAQKKGWTTPEKSIEMGAAYIAQKYIAIGQDTLYLQKFNVDSQDGVIYTHQYQANIQAPQSEGKKIYKSYRDLYILDSNINFIIPVYENMPRTISPLPNTQQFKIVTENVTVNDTGINIRENRTATSTSIAKVNTGDVLLRIEKGTTEIEGFIWDKVVLLDGTVGYIADKFVDKSDDVITCKVEAYTSTGANVRNGPGLTGTTIITTLPAGEKITIIDKAKYNINGYTWDRVRLSDGRQGYIAAEYLNSALGSIEGDIVKVTANGSLQLRKEPGTNKENLESLLTGTLLIRLETNVATVDDLQWDKVKTMTGKVGYVASRYLELIVPKIEKESETTMTKVVIDEENKIVKCEPNAKISYLLQQNSTAIIKDKNGNEITDTAAMLATGNIVTINEIEYNVVKLGDTSGDGVVDPRDSLRVLRFSVETYELKDEYFLAGDINKDGIVDSRDSLRILRFAVNSFKIEL